MAMIVLSLLFAVFIMVTWIAPQPEFDAATGEWNNNTNRARPDYRYESAEYISLAMAIVHVILTAAILVSFFIINHPRPHPWMVKLHRRCLGRRHGDTDGSEDDSKERGGGHLTTYILGWSTVWYLFLMLFSLLGVFFWGYFFAFHILHIVNFNQILNRVIKAVTKNGLALLMVFLLLAVFLYIFSLVNFAFYRELFDPYVGTYCDDMLQCMVTTSHRSFILTLHEGVEPAEGKPFTWMLHKTVVDILFFVLVTIIGLNIVFGIIVDTFAELRDSKWQADQEMQASCFICGIDSYDFERKPGGFDDHVHKEHNQWAYVFFFMHLDFTRPNDYTALELYVANMLETEEYDFFPKDKALSRINTGAGEEDKIKFLENKIAYLVQRMDELELEKAKEEERQRIETWEQKNKRLMSAVRAKPKAGGRPGPQSQAPKPSPSPSPQTQAVPSLKKAFSSPASTPASTPRPAAGIPLISITEDDGAYGEEMTIDTFR